MYTMGHGNLNDGHTVSQGDKFKIVDSEGRVLYESVESLSHIMAEGETREDKDNKLEFSIDDGIKLQATDLKFTVEQGSNFYESIIEKLKEIESVKDKEDEDIGDTLVIWLKNGQTLYFNKVRDLWELSDRLAFTYFGMETQVRREANFKLDCIAGYAVEEG